MDITTQRRCLTTLAGGLLIGAAGAIGWSFSGIDDSSPTPQQSAPQITPQTTDLDSGNEASDAMLQIALRRPLTDPPPPKPRVVKPRVIPAPPMPPALKLTLVGTIIDSDNSLAIIADSAGEFDVKGVGESLELTPKGVSVTSIESEQVEVQYQGKKSTFKLNREVKSKALKPARSGKPRRGVR